MRPFLGLMQSQTLRHFGAPVGYLGMESALDHLPVRLCKFLSSCDASLARHKVGDIVKSGAVRVFCPRDDVPESKGVFPESLQAGDVIDGFEEVSDINEGILVYDDDLVYMKGKLIQPGRPKLVYFLFHKPKGYLTMMGDGYSGKPTLQTLVNDLPPGVVHVGRLDKLTSGLLLLTNDGDLNNAILQKGAVDKEYHLLLSGPNISILDPAIQQLLEGVNLNDGFAKADNVEVRDPCEALRYCREAFFDMGRGKKQRKKRKKNFRDKESGGRALDICSSTIDLTPEYIRSRWSLISVTISEGRNRIVRRMAKAVSLDLVHLHRARIGNLTESWPRGLSTDSSSVSLLSDADSTSEGPILKKAKFCSEATLGQPIKIEMCSKSGHDVQFLAAGNFRELSSDEVDCLWQRAGGIQQNRKLMLYKWLDKAWYSRYKKDMPDLRLEAFFTSHGIDLPGPYNSPQQTRQMDGDFKVQENSQS